MKVLEINGEYYIRDGKVLRRATLEEAIDALLEEIRKIHSEHGEGD
ncbi:hypothetical protein AciM339_0223 [Aciduliprofundum sp. MAR08-339]|nr:hypothetical protein AciM339_0191 [Aciduliprofundum sp. MAR08-339]AGB04120.1 hypothetical protein AciM339_0223 [Aciduliprofundum sp. MAR08-339]